jgi:hypothetical protein
MTSPFDPGAVASAADAADAAEVSYYRPRARVRRNTENVRHPRHPRRHVDWAATDSPGYECQDPERVKREGWREQGVVDGRLYAARLAKEAAHG